MYTLTWRLRAMKRQSDALETVTHGSGVTTLAARSSKCSASLTATSVGKATATPARADRLPERQPTISIRFNLWNVAVVYLPTDRLVRPECELHRCRRVFFAAVG
jgi:hypothetical protein